MKNFVPGHGNPDAKLLILGEAPARQEVKAGRNFVGRAGDILRTWCKATDIDLNNVWLTNVSKYMGPGGKFDRLREVGVDVVKQRDLTRKEIEKINPNCVLALGKRALECAAGHSKISDWRGSILPYIHGLDIKVVATYHPASFLYETKGGTRWNDQAYVKLDVARALAQSKFRGIKHPEHNLWICTSPEQLDDFFWRYRKYAKVYVDIETPHSIKYARVVGFAFTPNEGVSLDMFNPNISKYDRVRMWKIVDKMFRKHLVCGQNFKFDQLRLEAMGFRFPRTGVETMLKAHTLYPEFKVGLAFLASIYTEVPYYKDDYSEFIKGKQSWEQMMIYNARDAVVTCEVDQNTTQQLKDDNKWDFYMRIPRKMHSAYIKIQRVGILMDSVRREELRKKYEAKIEFLNNRIAEAAGHPVNVNSYPQMKKLLYEELGLPKREKADKETLVELLAHPRTTEKARRIIVDVLECRRYRKGRSTYITAIPDFDDRMRTSVRLGGTETGRTSNSQLGPPDRHQVEFYDEFDRKIKKRDVGLAFQTISKHGDQSDIREMFVADPYHYFVEADKSQAEARIVAALAKDHKLLEFFNTRDVHTWTASLVFSLPISQITGEHRFAGKVIRHGGHYDMREYRLMQTVNTLAARFGINISISLTEAKQYLDKFHEFSPRIRGVFHKRIKKWLTENKYELTTPFGRRRTFFGKPGTELNKEAYAYIPQATVADDLKLAIYEIQSSCPYIRIFNEAHDGISCLVHMDHLELAIKNLRRIMTSTIDVYGIPVTIPCEVSYGTVWSDLKEV